MTSAEGASAVSPVAKDWLCLADSSSLRMLTAIIDSLSFVLV